jgi:hypothetical protein
MARKRRRQSLKDWAAMLQVSVPTLMRMEKGNPTVSMGVYATALWMINRQECLGHGSRAQGGPGGPRGRDPRGGAAVSTQGRKRWLKRRTSPRTRSTCGGWRRAQPRPVGELRLASGGRAVTHAGPGEPPGDRGGGAQGPGQRAGPGAAAAPHPSGRVHGRRATQVGGGYRRSTRLPPVPWSLRPGTQHAAAGNRPGRICEWPQSGQIGAARKATFAEMAHVQLVAFGELH